MIFSTCLGHHLTGESGQAPEFTIFIFMQNPLIKKNDEILKRSVTMLWSQQPNNFKLTVENRKKKSLPCHELMARAT